MGLYDRKWFREAKREQAEPRQRNTSQSKKPEITTKEREPWVKKMPAPPEYVVWAARYQLALRRRTKKTFFSGLVIGALLATGLLWLLNLLAI